MFQPKWKNNSKDSRRTYGSWHGMIRRCHNPASPGYSRYGARGITVCERWRESYDAFVEDMGFSGPGMTIERIDNDGNYEPGNCRWATRAEQSYNTHRSIRLTYEGQTMTAGEWAKKLGIPYRTVFSRFKAGFPPEKILQTGSLVPAAQHGTLSMYHGKPKCRCDLCRKANNDYMRENRHRFPSASKDYRNARYAGKKSGHD